MSRVLLYRIAITRQWSSVMGSLFPHALTLGWGLCSMREEKVWVRILTDVASRWVPLSSREYSSGRGKASLLSPLYPVPHLAGGEGSMLVGIKLIQKD